MEKAGEEIAVLVVDEAIKKANGFLNSSGSSYLLIPESSF